jgi:hypothetical protein
MIVDNHPFVRSASGQWSELSEGGRMKFLAIPVVFLAFLAAGCGGSASECLAPNTFLNIDVETITTDVEQFTVEQAKTVKVTKAQLEAGQVVLYEVIQAYISPDLVLLEVLIGRGIDAGPFGAYFDEQAKVKAYVAIYSRQCAGDEWESRWETVSGDPTSVVLEDLAKRERDVA